MFIVGHVTVCSASWFVPLCMEHQALEWWGPTSQEQLLELCHPLCLLLLWHHLNDQETDLEAGLSVILSSMKILPYSQTKVLISPTLVVKCFHIF